MCPGYLFRSDRGGEREGGGLMKIMITTAAQRALGNEDNPERAMRFIEETAKEYLERANKQAGWITALEPKCSSIGSM